MQLSTGFIIAGAFADKLRKTLFAQLASKVKEGSLQASEIARAAAEINRLLYVAIVDKLKMNKGDVVRIRVEYELEDGRIKWKLETLSLEVFRRVSEEEVSKVVEEIKSLQAEQEAEAGYEVEKVGATDIGDLIYSIRKDGQEIGKLLVTPLDDSLVVRAAIKEPARLIQRVTIKKVDGIDETLRQRINEVLSAGSEASNEEVEKFLSEVEALLQS